MRRSNLLKSSIVFLVFWLGACATDEVVEEEPTPPQIVLSGQDNLSWDLEVGESGQVTPISTV